MVNFDPRINPLLSNATVPTPQTEVSGVGAPACGNGASGFADAVKAASKYVSSVNDLQQASDASIENLLAGKNTDLTAVVSAVAEADVSFKVLVGVRNKLIEAYKQTMNMPL